MRERSEVHYKNGRERGMKVTRGELITLSEQICSHAGSKTS
jgi:hypothetical protein